MDRRNIAGLFAQWSLSNQTIEAHPGPEQSCERKGSQTENGGYVPIFGAKRHAERNPNMGGTHYRRRPRVVYAAPDKKSVEF
jgi:hypothetical protein